MHNHDRVSFLRMFDQFQYAQDLKSNKTKYENKVKWIMKGIDEALFGNKCINLKSWAIEKKRFFKVHQIRNLSTSVDIDNITIVCSTLLDSYPWFIIYNTQNIAIHIW